MVEVLKKKIDLDENISVNNENSGIFWKKSPYKTFGD